MGGSEDGVATVFGGGVETYFFLAENKRVATMVEGGRCRWWLGQTEEGGDGENRW
jgi:hypothetical protein